MNELWQWLVGVGGLSFLAGLFLGHRLAIGRDKRREFNDAALPIREWLLKEIESVGWRRPSEIEIDTFEACLSAWQRRRFVAALQAYRSEFTAQTRQDGSGGLYFENEEPIKQLARSCLKYTKRR